MRQDHSQTPSRRGGFSLVEIVGATALLSVVIGTIGLVQMRNHDAERMRVAQELAQTSCRRALDRIAEELEGIDGKLLGSDPLLDKGTSTLSYQHVTGTPCRLSLQLARGEYENDLDDNGDELVDEKRLVLTRAVGAPHPVSVDLCVGISGRAEDQAEGQPAGFWIQRSGGELMIHLTLEVPCGHGQVARSSQVRSVALHE